MITVPRQQVSILAGASGAGKTTLVMQCIADWIVGKDFTASLKWDATRIAYLVADRTCEEVRIRATRLGIPLSRMAVYGIQDDLKFDLDILKTPEAALRKCLSYFKIDFDMLVIDPLALFMEGDTNNFKEVAISLMRIGRIAIERNITILAVHHASKSRSDYSFKRPQDRINGSGAFQGFSGTQMVLIEGKEDDLAYDRLFVIPHMGPMKTAHLVRDEVGDFAVLPSEPMEVMNKIKAKGLLEQFATGEVFSIAAVHKFADSQGIARSAMFSQICSMLTTGELVKEGRGEYRKSVPA